MEFHDFHDHIECFPAVSITRYGKPGKYVTGFADFHVELISVRDMIDPDPDATGRATNGIPGWGIAGQDVY